MRIVFLLFILFIACNSLMAQNNIGIGTTNPTQKLDINGNAKVDTVITNAIKILNSAGANKVLKSDAFGNASWQNNSMPNGTSPGQMLYWDGSAWLTVAPGQYNQTLHYCNGVPVWGACLPLVQTGGNSNYSASIQNLTGTILDSGGLVITERGFCFDTLNPFPTLANSYSVSTSTGTSINSDIQNLKSGVKYYYRAYAITSAGVGYGMTDSFTKPVVVGSICQGGIVFYILQPGNPGYSPTEQHGFIYDVNYGSYGYKQWSSETNYYVGTTSNALGEGENNTNEIMSASIVPTSGAAFFCYNHTAGGYTDWFLPNDAELLELNLYSFQSGFIWSSYEYSAISASRNNYGSGIAAPKTQNYFVVPVRKF